MSDSQLKCGVVYTFDFLEEVACSKPSEDFVAGMLELDGSLQTQLHLIHPAPHTHTHTHTHKLSTEVFCIIRQKRVCAIIGIEGVCSAG